MKKVTVPTSIGDVPGIENRASLIRSAVQILAGNGTESVIVRKLDGSELARIVPPGTSVENAREWVGDFPTKSVTPESAATQARGV